MKDFASKKEKYFCNYADAISAVFRKVRYGIASCCPKEDLDLITMRYELSEWQSSLDYSAAALLRRNIKWKPFIFNDPSTTCITINIIDNAAESFKFDPAVATWVIEHNLLFNPNVTTTDLSGQEIQGTVQYVGVSKIHVVFSTPVSGWAYLS